MNQVKIFRENTRRLEIGRKANISVKELAEILRVDKSGISRTVEELVQKGYVERKHVINH